MEGLGQEEREGWPTVGLSRSLRFWGDSPELPSPPTVLVPGIFQ